MIWLAIATMTAGVALCLVWPLAHRGTGSSETAGDVAFYRSQLDDLDIDLERGTVSSADADATRTEIARRLLAAARRPSVRPALPSRVARVAAVIAAVAIVPALSLVLYLQIGRPEIPDVPLASRASGSTTDIAAAIPRIEAHLAAHPEDGKGHALLAPIYMRLGRFDDAVRAYAGALAGLGESAELRAGLGQAQVMAADGVVTGEARAAFDKALLDDPKLPQARFFQALAAEQDGDAPRAAELWRALAADTPADASWRPSLEQHLAGVTGRPQTLTQSQPAAPSPPGGAAGAAIAALSPDAQRAAIAGMVEGLAGRLAKNGRDPDGWLRLVRAYKVMGDDAKARAALADARNSLAGDADGAARVAALGRDLGLEGGTP